LPRYSLRDSPIPIPPEKWRLGFNVLGLGLLIIEQIVNVLAALGALMMILRRKASLISRQVGLLALATTMLLTVLRFSGTLAVAYGQERAQLQGLVLLSISMCWTIRSLAGVRNRRKARVLTLAAISLAVVLVNTSYLVTAVLGGKPSVNLANTGPGFEYFYTTRPEVAAARWLGKAARPGQLVYTDEYGQVPLAIVTDIRRGLFIDLTPLTINQHAWVYASRANIINRRAFALYNEHIASYVFPASFLDANFDLVFTDGSSEVFHR
jgi:hypothetical protein